MPSHVQQSETQLTATQVPHIEVGCIQQLLDQLVRHRLARFVMDGNLMEKRLFRQPVFHQLGGQLHKVAIDIGAGQAGVGASGKEAMQGMTELVQKRIDLIIRQQGGLVGRRTAEIHDNDDLRPFVPSLGRLVLRLDVVHPGSRLLAVAREEVRIENGQEGAVLIIHFVGLHLRMIDRNLLVASEGDAIQLGGQSEHTLADMIQLEVGAGHLVIELESTVLQLLGIIVPVPRHQIDRCALLLLGKGRDRLILLQGHRPVGFAQLIQQLIDTGRRLGHGVCQLVIGKGRITHQAGDLQPDVDNLPHDLLVVIFVILVADRHERPIQLFA